MSIKMAKDRLGQLSGMLGLNLAIEGYDLFDVWLNATKSSPVIPDKLEANLPFLLHKTFDRSLVVAWEFDQQTVSLLSSPIVKASVKMEADSFFFFLLCINIIDEAVSMIVKSSVFSCTWRRG